MSTNIQNNAVLQDIKITEKEALVVLPNGDFYRHSALNLLKVDYDKNLYKPIHITNLKDPILQSQFLIPYKGKTYLRVDLANEYEAKENGLVSLGSIDNILNFSDYDLALALENMDDCISMMTRVKTEWSEEWLDLPDGFKVRKHKFVNKEEYVQVCAILSNTDLRKTSDIYFQTYNCICSVAGKTMPMIPCGLNSISVRTEAEAIEILKSREDKDFIFTYRTDIIDIFNNNILVSRTQDISAVFLVDSGQYRMYEFWSDSPLLGSEIILVKL